MSLLFWNADGSLPSETMVAEALRQARENARKQHRAYIEEARNMVAGGDAENGPLQYLQRHNSEEDADWWERRRRFAHHGYVGLLARFYSSSLYGKEVIRGTGNDTADETYKEQLIDAGFAGSGQRIVSFSQVAYGDGFAYITWDVERDVLSIPIVDPSNVDVEVDENDPYRIVTFIEERPNLQDEKESRTLIWRKDYFIVVDKNGKPVPWRDASGAEQYGWTPNPYGFIPYVHWRGLPMIGEYFGMSPIRDAVAFNKLLNDAASAADWTHLMQGFSIPVWKDPDETGEKLVFAETKLIKLNSDNADFWFESPNSPLAEMRQYVEFLTDQLIRSSGLPTSAVRGGTSASGYALELEYRLAAQIVGDLMIEATQAEKDLMRKVFKMVNMHGNGALPEEPVEPSIEFDTNIVPRDTIADKQQDMAEVAAGLMPPEEFIKTWYPDEDPEDWLARIAAQRPKSGLEALLAQPVEGETVL